MSQQNIDIGLVAGGAALLLGVGWAAYKSRQSEGADAGFNAFSSERIASAAAAFPSAFGLYNFPGKVFRISEHASYENGDQVMLYTEVQREDGTWVAFAKGTPAELRQHLVELKPAPGGRAFLRKISDLAKPLYGAVTTNGGDYEDITVDFRVGDYTATGITTFDDCQRSANVFVDGVKRAGYHVTDVLTRRPVANRPGSGGVSVTVKP